MVWHRNRFDRCHIGLPGIHRIGVETDMKKHVLEIVVKKKNVILRKTVKHAGSEQIARDVFHVEHDRLRKMQVEQDVKEIRKAQRRGFYDVYLRYIKMNQKTNGLQVSESFMEEHFTFANDQKFGRVDDVSKAK